MNLWSRAKEKIKKWRLKKAIRKALKNTMFQPPCADKKIEGQRQKWLKYLKGADAEANDIVADCLPPLSFESGVTIPLDKFHPTLLEQRAKYLNRPESSLPTYCPQCNKPVTPSKIDDRVVGCMYCKLMFMTPEAHDDPNIQRDITHANAGITPNQTKMGGRISGQDVMDVMRIRREIELGQATAFGEGYTRGKHAMSRKEFNKKKRENLENENV